MATAGEITSLLAALRRGDPNAESNLVELIYGEFHARAQKHMRLERPGHTLQPTALVHETYLRLIQDNAVDWENRAHFYATASIVMRRILVGSCTQARIRQTAGCKTTARREELMPTNGGCTYRSEDRTHYVEIGGFDYWL